MVLSQSPPTALGVILALGASIAMVFGVLVVSRELKAFKILGVAFFCAVFFGAVLLGVVLLGLDN